MRWSTDKSLIVYDLLLSTMEQWLNFDTVSSPGLVQPLYMTWNGGSLGRSTRTCTW